MNFNLIYPAILAFLLMVIGVVLTAVEFYKLEKEESEGNDPSRAGRGKK